MEEEDVMEAEANVEVKNTSTTTNQEMRDDQKKHGDDHEDGDHNKHQQLPLMALNHVSRLCRNVEESINFYTKVLGFVRIERPPAFDFDGAWLFNYGVGIHLVQSEDEERLPETHDLDPMYNHISFQCEDMRAIEEKLKELNMKYMKRTVEDDKNGTVIDQLFFRDPDGFMIEICNSENLKLVPAGSIGKLRLPFDRHNPPVELDDGNKDHD
ncbi:Glyoxalase-like domain containing protein [Parasponia andersonii]|uniref:Glyoxalase-like domain containing protein n=1 Tax=Parasponia andersonii TaxID=3476 RepID=A0A2P5DM04_PARAD|nr:Glyoxalase-like domain containing protein [Parasponia andersonii]